MVNVPFYVSGPCFNKYLMQATSNVSPNINPLCHITFDMGNIMEWDTINTNRSFLQMKSYFILELRLGLILGSTPFLFICCYKKCIATLGLWKP